MNCRPVDLRLAEDRRRRLLEMDVDAHLRAASAAARAPPPRRAAPPSGAASGGRRGPPGRGSSRPRAASRPSRPPPITAARRRAPRPGAMMASQSSRVRNTKTPGLNRPSAAAQALDRRHEGAAAGGDDQLVVGRRRGRRRRRPCRALAVDARDARARVQGHAVLGVPVERVDEDVLGVVGAGQDAREEDAVVVAVRLVAEHRRCRSWSRPPRAHHLLERGGRPPCRCR